MNLTNITGKKAKDLRENVLKMKRTDLAKQIGCANGSVCVYETRAEGKALVPSTYANKLRTLLANAQAQNEQTKQAEQTTRASLASSYHEFLSFRANNEFQKAKIKFDNEMNLIRHGTAEEVKQYLFTK